ncbi:MAG: SAM-dependent DNA methyltransferase [Saprospiraceae bacterium]|nr:SAM-dependent DNA methyltransferase [Saprospiraceae bacterium]
MSKKEETNHKQNLVKSKERVANHGEVFTAEREVNAMLDMVKQETERIESRFLEPACGDGNFLAEILRRKLDVVEARYKKSQLEFERYAVIAVASIYGVDILQDNVEDCRTRLFNIFNERYTTIYRSNCKDECRRSVKFILDKNILWGDALSLRTPDEKSEPIVFSEWEAVNGSMMKRREYTLEKLLLPRHSSSSNDLFSDLGEQAFLPNPVNTHPPIHFLKLGVNDTDELQP